MDEIRQWLEGGRNYAEGVALLARLHPNKLFVSRLLNGTPRRHADKLEYELRKFLSQPARTTPQKAATAKPQAIPPAILRAKDRCYELFTRISVMHRNLYELGEGNTGETVARRKAILDERLPLIRQYERLHLLKERYFDTGRVPAELVPLLDEEVKQQDEPDSPSPRSAFAELSDIELVRKEHALKVAIGKQRNRLQYQSLKRMDEPNPMPPGPLRERIEQKLASLRSEYAEVARLLEERR